MENPFKMDDLGVPLFLETPKSQTASFRQKQRLLLPLIGASETKSQHILCCFHFQVGTGLP